MPLQPISPTLSWLLSAARCSAVTKLGIDKPAEASRVFCKNLLLDVICWLIGYGYWLLVYWVKSTVDSPLLDSNLVLPDYVSFYSLFSISTFICLLEQ